MGGRLVSDAQSPISKLDQDGIDEEEEGARSEKWERRSLPG